MIHRATARDHAELTDIAYAAKRHWNYPASYFELWREELTITPASIAGHEVHLHRCGGETTAFYALAELEEDLQVGNIVVEAGLWLEHMFVRPRYMGQGIGRLLFAHCLTICALKNHAFLGILADPNARSFYEKLGCLFVRDYPSTIPGRTTPYLRYRLKDRKQPPNEPCHD